MFNRLEKPKDFFLPDFCQTPSVFMVVLTAELLAVLFALLNLNTHSLIWDHLGLYSLAIQIIALSSVAGLCVLRPFLAKFSDSIAGLLSLSLILFITLVFTLCLIKFFWLDPINLSNSNQFSLMLRNLLISGIIGSVVLRYFYLQQQYNKQITMEASARLEALQARIRPHFLFNSLNVISSLTRIDAEKAEMAIQDLCDLFRATLDSQQELIPLADELKNCDAYLSIEKLRLGDRLQIEKDLPSETMTILIPPLSLQPILENAVYHGIQMLAEGGLIKIQAHIQSTKLIIQVSNPKTVQVNTKGHGMALANITQRLEVIYAGKAQLKLLPDDHQYRVELTLPIVK